MLSHILRKSARVRRRKSAKRGVPARVSGLDLLLGRKFLNLVSRQVALDYLRKNWYILRVVAFRFSFIAPCIDTRERGRKATTFYSHHAIAIAW